MRSFVARKEYTSFCRQTWLPVVITSTPAPSSLRAILEVMPAPLAAFSPLAMTKSTARSSRKPDSQRSSASRPGWPNTSPMKRMFMAPVYPTALGAVPTPADGGAASSAAEDQPDGALGGPEQRLGEQADDEHAGRGQAHGHGDAELRRRRLGLDLGALRRLAEVHVPDDPQVVVGGHGAHDDSYDGQPGEVGLDDRGEEVELAPEADRRRDARERHHEHGHEDRCPGHRAAQPAHLAQRVRELAAVADPDEHAERPEVHERVGGQIEEDGADAQRVARLAGGDEAEREIPRVGDARVGEHALEVTLRQRQHVPDHHRENGQDRHRVGPRLPCLLYTSDAAD